MIRLLVSLVHRSFVVSASGLSLEVEGESVRVLANSEDLFRLEDKLLICFVARAALEVRRNSKWIQGCDCILFAFCLTKIVIWTCWRAGCLTSGLIHMMNLVIILDDLDLGSNTRPDRVAELTKFAIAILSLVAELHEDLC